MLLQNAESSNVTSFVKHFKKNPDKTRFFQSAGENKTHFDFNFIKK